MDENSHAKRKESPTSESAAAETLASTNRDEEDLPHTKDLSTRGMEDPRTSREALVEGNSAKSTDGTWVLLEGVPHEMQTEPHSSLPLTPSRCKQEVADSVVMAERTNGTAEMAKPMEIADVDSEKAALGGKLVERACRVDEGDETNADVDRTATLGEDPATMACGVDEGDEMGRKDLRLPKAGLYCEERHQHNENAMDNIPSTYGMPLEGEWVICASSKVGCSGGIVEQAGVDKAEALEPVDTPDESDTLVIVSIEPDAEDGTDIPCVYLGGTRWHACHIEGLGNGADTSRYQLGGLRGLTDGSRGLTDASNASNSAEMAVISQGEGGGTYLHAGGAKREPDKPAGCGNLADMSSVHMDAHSDGDESETSANVRINVRMGRIDSKPQNSPDMREIETLKPIRRWKRVSVNNVDVYVPWDAPVEVLN